MPAVSIVIPNYNGMEHLPLCLNSIFKQTYSDFEVIVVDNGSSDSSVSYVAENFPQVRWIQFSENKGFACAVNAGITATRNDYIALLNNDIELTGDWLEKMIEAIRQHDEIGSVACKMMNFYHRNIIDAAGDELSCAGNGRSRGEKQLDNGSFDSFHYVFGACAGAALYRRKMFDEVGLFDESFFAWGEDIDHDFRSQLLGYKCLYTPHAVCYHKRGGTKLQITSLAAKLHARNPFFYLLKNVPWQIFLLRAALIILSRIYNAMKILQQGFIKEQLQAAVEVIKFFPVLLAKRKDIQSRRNVSLRYVNSLFKF